MIEIYHNPRCGKSREGLNILQESGKDFKIIKYLEETPSIESLNKIINLLKIKPIELVRQNEKIWKEHFKNSNLSDDELIKIMVDNPILIERPIVINGNKAIVGRPPSKILEII
jgi:arsenate reductase